MNLRTVERAMTKAANFKQSDVTRALRGAAAAGVVVSHLEIDASGRIVVHVGRVPLAADASNEWDEELER